MHTGVRGVCRVTDKNGTPLLCFLFSGAIEHRDRPNTPAKFFTQADVNNGKIIYRPPPAPSHLQELYQYSFIGEMTRHLRDFTKKSSPHPKNVIVTFFGVLLKQH